MEILLKWGTNFVGLDMGPEFAFLTNPQVVLMLLVHKTYFE